MNTECRFMSLGYGHLTQVNMIWAVSKLGSAQVTRLLAQAKAEERFLDWTSRRPMKTLVFLTNGMVIGSPFSVTTLYQRLRKATEQRVIVDQETLNGLTAESAKLLSDAYKAAKMNKEEFFAKYLDTDTTQDDADASVRDGYMSLPDEEYDPDGEDANNDDDEDDEEEDDGDEAENEE